MTIDLRHKVSDRIFCSYRNSAMDLEAHHFCCGDCLKSFSCPVLVTVHHRVEHEFRCACERLFDSKMSLVKHMNASDCRFPFAVEEFFETIDRNFDVETATLNESIDYKCSFDPMAACIRHIDDGLLCIVCDKMSTDRTEMLCHITEMHGSTLSDLSNWHLNVVVGKHSVVAGEVRLCIYCGKVGVEKRYMYLHLCSEHKDETGPHIADLKKIRGKTQLVRTIPLNRLYAKLENGRMCCQFCSFYCPSLRLMVAHLRTHQKLLKEMLGEVLKDMTFCKVSGRTKWLASMPAKTSKGWVGGKNICNKNNSQGFFDRKQRKSRINVLSRYIRACGLGYKCRLCPRRSSKRSNLFQHIEAKHENVLKDFNSNTCIVMRSILKTKSGCRVEEKPDICVSSNCIDDPLPEPIGRVHHMKSRCRLETADYHVILAPDMSPHTSQMHAEGRCSLPKNFGRVCGTINFKTEPVESGRLENFESPNQESGTMFPGFSLQQPKLHDRIQGIISDTFPVKEENLDDCTFEGNNMSGYTDSERSITCNVSSSRDIRGVELQDVPVNFQKDFDNLVMPNYLMNYHNDLSAFTSGSSLTSAMVLEQQQQQLGFHSSLNDFIPLSNVTKKVTSSQFLLSKKSELKSSKVIDYHLATGMHACSVCKQTFISKSGLYKHCRKFHPKPCATQHNIQQASSEVGTLAKRWSCVVCQSRFASYLGWRKHFMYCRQKSLKGGSKSCHRVSSKTELEFLRENCLRSGKRFACRLCGCQYSNRFRVFTHIRSRHDMVDVSDLNESMTKNCGTLQSRNVIQSCIVERDGCFICKVCDSRFNMKDYARKHLRLKHPEQYISPTGSSPLSKAETSSSTLESKSRSFSKGQKSFSSSKSIQTATVAMKPILKSCGQCFHSCSTLKDLMIHAQLVHLDQNSRPIKCSMCSYSFQRMNNAATHFVYTHCRIGQGVSKRRKRTISCKLCDINFPSRTSRFRHYTNVHTGICVRCDLCVACFLTEKDYARHFRIVHQMDQTSGTEKM